MFLDFYKNKVKAWIKKNCTRDEVIKYLIPLVIFVLDNIAKKTKNKIDDEIVNEIRNWYNNYQWEK